MTYLTDYSKSEIKTGRSAGIVALDVQKVLFRES